MITFEITKGTDSIEQIIDNLQKNVSLSEISKIVQNDIIEETKKRGWKRTGSTIKRRVINSNEHEIYLGGNLKNKDVSVYLDTGTKRHFVAPVKKKALSWVQGGTRFFSKGHFVSGIKATHFFRIYDSTVIKINAIIDKAFKV